MAQTRRMEMQNERAELQMRRGFRPTFMGPRGHIVVPQCHYLYGLVRARAGAGFSRRPCL
jgi:hypothetical protein